MICANYKIGIVEVQKCEKTQKQKKMTKIRIKKKKIKIRKIPYLLTLTTFLAKSLRYVA